MTWFKKAQTQPQKSCPKPLGYKINNNLALAHAEFEKYGYWQEEFYYEFPISLIKFEAWNKDREAENYKLLAETGSMPPIRLSYDEKNNEYKLVDGNHRLNAAKELGYNCVPAIISRLNKHKPRDLNPDENNSLSKYKLEYLANDIMSLLKNNFQFSDISYLGIKDGHINIKGDVNNVSNIIKHIQLRIKEENNLLVVTLDRQIEYIEDRRKLNRPEVTLRCDMESLPRQLQSFIK